MPMNVASMRKGKHLGQPTPLSRGLVKPTGKNLYNANPIKVATTTAKNPAHSMKHMGNEIKLGPNTIRGHNSKRLY